MISQNFYRIANDRFTQIGQGWLKHGFAALEENLCGSFQALPGFDRLDPGCSDPYGAGLNGGQSRLGPKSDINPVTGAYSWPHTARGQTGNSIYKRIQVPQADLQVAGAQYFIASHYVTQDEPPFGTDLNNSSYRRVNVSGNSVFPTDSTQREKYAVEAWSDSNPDVTLSIVDIPGDGRFIVASLAIDNNDGTWRYEYAVQNYNSHRSAGAFRVPVPAGVSVSAIGFHDIDNHSGEIYDNTDWSSSTAGNQVAWSTQSFKTNPNANALRWDHVYSFWFTADAGPEDTSGQLDMFMPGEIKDAGMTLVAPSGPACVADVTTNNTNPGDANYGVADGEVTVADLAYFVEQWVAGNASVADVTTNNANPGDADYGVADGEVTVSDLSYFVEQWVAGCP